MKCEACREETPERFSILANGWRLQVCAGCRDALKKGKGKRDLHQLKGRPGERKAGK